MHYHPPSCESQTTRARRLFQHLQRPTSFWCKTLSSFIVSCLEHPADGTTHTQDKTPCIKPGTNKTKYQNADKCWVISILVFQSKKALEQFDTRRVRCVTRVKIQAAQGSLPICAISLVFQLGNHSQSWTETLSKNLVLREEQKVIGTTRD